MGATTASRPICVCGMCMFVAVRCSSSWVCGGLHEDSWRRERHAGLCQQQLRAERARRTRRAARDRSRRMCVCVCVCACVSGRCSLSGSSPARSSTRFATPWSRRLFLFPPCAPPCLARPPREGLHLRKKEISVMRPLSDGCTHAFSALLALRVCV